MLSYNKHNTAYAEFNEVVHQNKYSSILLLCDSNTEKYCLPEFLEKSGFDKEQLYVLKINPGEQEKTIETAIDLWRSLLDRDIDRNALLINLGGGVITDLGGFVASVFKRGISYINVPTTLLAMVDASSGGKTGIDFGGLKNAIGTFKDPVLTIIDTNYLHTLELKEKLNGYAEMLKHGLIADKIHWKELSGKSLNEIGYPEIEHSVNIKLNIVKEDPLEKGRRKLLNFGHTIGHAIEAFFIESEKKISIKHGEAVAAGLVVESFLSHQLGYLTRDEFDEILHLLLGKYGKIRFKESELPSIFKHLTNDKKNLKNKILFTLISAIGCGIYNIEVEKGLIFDSLAYYSDQ